MSTKAERTRRDLVDAAIESWSEDPTASLGHVAARAGVGRTTLNRHFVGRAQLLVAVDTEARRRYVEAIARSRPEQGSGREALLRVCTELLQLGPVLGLIFADSALVDPDAWFTDDDDPLGRIIWRGLSDATLDPTLPGEWIGTVVWTTLFGGHLVIKAGTLTGHEAAQALTQTLTSGLGTPTG